MKTITTMVEELQAKVQSSTDVSDIDLYCGMGLSLLGLITSDEFFNIPEVPEDRFSEEGMFYQVPAISKDCANSLIDNQTTVAVVYSIKDNTSFCPVRIDFQYIDDRHSKLWLYDQTEQHSRKILLASYTDNGSYPDMKLLSEIKNVMNITLSELLTLLGITKESV